MATKYRRTRRHKNTSAEFRLDTARSQIRHLPATLRASAMLRLQGYRKKNRGRLTHTSRIPLQFASRTAACGSSISEQWTVVSGQRKTFLTTDHRTSFPHESIDSSP